MQKDIKRNKENIEINFGARENNKQEDEYSFAFVMRCTIKEIAMIDDFLEANNINVRYRKLSPGFLKIVAIPEGERQ